MSEIRRIPGVEFHPDMTPPNLSFSPKDVDLSNQLCSTFGKAEIEDAAMHLIEYLVERNRAAETPNNWFFSFSGLLDYYVTKKLNVNEMLFGLFGSWLDDGPFVVREDGFYIVNWGNSLQVAQEFLKRIAKHVHER
jgi:hypothetical protein